MAETPERRKLVLVVDDDAAVRTLVAKALQAKGYDVQQADGGLAASELLGNLERTARSADLRRHDAHHRRVLAGADDQGAQGAGDDPHHLPDGQDAAGRPQDRASRSAPGTTCRSRSASSICWTRSPRASADLARKPADGEGRAAEDPRARAASCRRAAASAAAGVPGGAALRAALLARLRRAWTCGRSPSWPGCRCSWRCTGRPPRRAMLPRLGGRHHDELRGLLLAAEHAEDVQRLPGDRLHLLRPRRVRLPGRAHRSPRVALRARHGARLAGALVFAAAFAASELVYPLLFPWYYAATVHQVPVLTQLGGPGRPDPRGPGARRREPRPRRGAAGAARAAQARGGRPGRRGGHAWPSRSATASSASGRSTPQPRRRPRSPWASCRPTWG